MLAQESLAVHPPVRRVASRRVAKVNRCLLCSYIIQTGWEPDTVNRLRLLSAGKTRERREDLFSFRTFLIFRVQVILESTKSNLLGRKKFRIETYIVSV